MNEPTIRLNVDVTNPGQFFACCGLLELADRLWPGAEGWFAPDAPEFRIACAGTLRELIDTLTHAELKHVRADDAYSSPLEIGAPFGDLTVDWWESDQTGARDLKVWAGTMESHGIAHAMQNALRSAAAQATLESPSSLFDVGMVVAKPDEPNKKKEPYYFDARRAPNAHSRDVGFSANLLSLTTTAHPAVELLCLIGIQVARPRKADPTAKSRVYDYFTWPTPLPANLLLAASTGMLALPGMRGYRFENWFRTGQKKHKAFRSAVPLS